MHSKRVRIFILVFALTLIIIFSLIGGWLFRLDKTISARLEGKRFLPPVEYYTAPMRIFGGQKLSKASLKDSLKRLRYREVSAERGLRPSEYSFLSPEACQSNLGEDLPTDTVTCALIAKTVKKSKDDDNSEPEKGEFLLIAFGSEDIVFQVYGDEPLVPQAYIELDEVLFAQYYGAEPIIRDVVSLGEAPAVCLNAVVAIEDPGFFEHGGISFSGILRAVYKNITHAGFSQGGSTITQQLIKNYFLNPEKTLKRKVTEMAMAILLETHATKDDILETYINEIYMGQNGPFQIRGFASASNYYFSKDLTDLNLSECAMLAAILNSPGLYSPFNKQENALKRRSLVLSRMAELNFVTDDEVAVAEKFPLPKSPQKVLSDPAPFFVDAVRREIERKQIDTSEGLKIYTTLDLQSQEAAQTAVRIGAEKLENDFKQLKDLKGQGKSLEASLVAADPLTGDVQAIVGGRNFKSSQYNRAIQSQRQVGSIFKPIVYLTALQNGIEGEKPTPLTLLSDERFTIKYDKQEWSPINYDKKSYGQIPMYFALKNSLNVSTAQLAINTGIKDIVKTAHELGIKSELKPVPALSLGAFELNPYEVLQVYTTLARFGKKTNLTIVRRIEALNGEILYMHEPEESRASNQVETAILVSMMKQTIQSGSASAVPLLGFLNPAAGKTGTTSDTKDAWFAGFTPYHVAVVWVGYDDNTQSGLTGASGAVPIWADYMKRAASQYPPKDFDWPEGTKQREISVEDQIALGVPQDKKKPLTPINLLFSN